MFNAITRLASGDDLGYKLAKKMCTKVRHSLHFITMSRRMSIAHKITAVVSYRFYNLYNMVGFK